MNLRELMIERILFMIDEEDLLDDYGLHDDDLPGLSDLDLLELYEDVHGLNDDMYNYGDEQ